MTEVPTFTATIYVGRKVRDTGEVIPESLARSACRQFCDVIGQCVTLTPTEFIYTNGSEPGFAVGFINYPRFPSTPEEIEYRAVTLARSLMTDYRQYKVSVVMPHKTIMLSRESDAA